MEMHQCDDSVAELAHVEICSQTRDRAAANQAATSCRMAHVS
jgi:hypothetical protein